VLVRLQHSLIRIGTFQRLAYLGEPDSMRRLVAYCLRHYYGEGDSPTPTRRVGRSIPRMDQDADTSLKGRGFDPDAPSRLLGHVGAAAAELAASYIAAGFVHGVLNSDNIAITAESFDYGPWRWTPFWDPAFTAAYFDHGGLYAFGRQPEAINWDVLQLAASLRLIAPPEALTSALESFPPKFQQALVEAICGRLGVAPRGGDADIDLLVAIETGLAAKTVEIDRFFFDWRGGRRRGHSPADPAYEGETFAAFRAAIQGYEATSSTDHPYWADEAPCSMHIDEVESIWKGIDEEDDWSLFEAKIGAVRRMGDAMLASA
jgi:uncharacterized protein YdiU (UPF0061 family)